jgi:hypothetical protein
MDSSARRATVYDLDDRRGEDPMRRILLETMGVSKDESTTRGEGTVEWVSSSDGQSGTKRKDGEKMQADVADEWPGATKKVSFFLIISK